MVCGSRSYQNRWALTISLIVLGTFIANLGVGIERSFGISQQLVSMGCKGIIVCSLVWCMPAILHQDIKPMFVISCSYILIILIQEIMFSRLNQWFLPVLSEHISLVLPLIICLSMIDDYQVLLRYLIRAAVLISIMVILSLALFGNGLFSSYEMGFSESLVLPINTMMLYIATQDGSVIKKASLLFLAAVDSSAILLYGSRGSMVAVAVFAICLLLLYGPKGKKVIIFKIAIVAIGFTLIIFYDLILQTIATVASEAGFHSRTLVLLVSDNATISSGRDTIWQAVLSDFSNDPLAIRGICSEYPIIGSYCHSIVITIMHGFGLIFGSIILCFIFILSLKTFRTLNSAGGLISLLLFSAVFPVALWSGTIWTMPYFWGWILMQLKIKEKSCGK